MFYKDIGLKYLSSKTSSIKRPNHLYNPLKWSYHVLDLYRTLSVAKPQPAIKVWWVEPGSKVNLSCFSMKFSRNQPCCQTIGILKLPAQHSRNNGGLSPSKNKWEEKRPPPGATSKTKFQPQLCQVTTTGQKATVKHGTNRILKLLLFGYKALFFLQANLNLWR